MDKHTQRLLMEAAAKKQYAAIQASQAAFDYDVALLAALGGSALEELANLGQANSDAPIAELPKIFSDFFDLRRPLIPEDALLGRGADALKVTVEEFPGVGHALTFVDLGMNNIHSSHVTAFAFDVKEHPRLVGMSAGRMYVRYKGGGLYRYMPQTLSRMIDMVKISKAMSQQIPTTLTIGEYIERVIKASHEAGKAICEVFNPQTNTWDVVLTKTQKKDVKESGDDAFKADIQRQVEEKALLVHRELDDRPQFDEEGAQAVAEEGAQVAQVDDPLPIEAQNSGTEIEPLQDEGTQEVQTPETQEPVAEMTLPTPETMPEPTDEYVPLPQATYETEGIGNEAEF
jgi:hypothetical protein